MEELATVREIAKELNVSVQAVYGMLKGKYKSYLVVKGGKKYVKLEILEALKKGNSPDQKEKQGQDVPKSEILEVLAKQLQEKDRQINELNERLREANQININNQVLLKEAQEKVKMLEHKQVEQEQEKQEETKKGLFSWFKK